MLADAGVPMIPEVNHRSADDDEVSRLRKELTATKFIAYGLLVVLMLAASSAPRIIVYSAFLWVYLVAVFLGCRWGLGDLEFSRGKAIGVTLGVGAVSLLFMLWILS